MKKILFLLMAMLLSFSMYAQKNVTTFLGIPVDGTKAVMRQKLISKGFTPFRIGVEECFKGEFNGKNVNIFIVTNNNKVFRLAVLDANTCDEAQIKIRFNNLVSQFENNKRYFSLGKYTIPDDEHISIEMSVDAKTYYAEYFQRPDTTILGKKYPHLKELMDRITPEQLDIIQRSWPLTDDAKKVLKESLDSLSDDEKSVMLKEVVDLLLESTKKHVWFRIDNDYGKYSIAMYYDNEYNKANGEDL